MKLVLKRTMFSNECTMGELYIDGGFMCYTVEDVVREPLNKNIPVSQWKVQNKTAIPQGLYEVVLTFSGRFQKILPILKDVPGFGGIRIHSGNTSEDTEGCLLVGMARDIQKWPKGSVLSSRKAMDFLMAKIQPVLDRHDKVTIEVVGHPAYDNKMKG